MPLKHRSPYFLKSTAIARVQFFRCKGFQARLAKRTIRLKGRKGRKLFWYCYVLPDEDYRFVKSVPRNWVMRYALRFQKLTRCRMSLAIEDAEASLECCGVDEYPEEAAEDSISAWLNY